VAERIASVDDQHSIQRKVYSGRIELLSVCIGDTLSQIDCDRLQVRRDSKIGSKPGDHICRVGLIEPEQLLVNILNQRVVLST